MTTDNDNLGLVRNVRVAAVADPTSGLFALRLAGVSEWLAIYDGGVPLTRSETYPPPAGSWAVGPNGWPRVVLPPVFTLTADVVGVNLPPSHVFRLDELAGWTVEHRTPELLEQGLLHRPDQRDRH